MAEKIYKSFLGTGWSFPPAFVRNTGIVNMVSDAEDIRDSLMILLQTELGERVMNPSYGTNLRDLLMEPIDQTLRTYFKVKIKDAILIHESRINVESITLTENNAEGVVLLELEYTIKATNARLNFVYPFYKEEGTNL